MLRIYCKARPLPHESYNLILFVPVNSELKLFLHFFFVVWIGLMKIGLEFNEYTLPQALLIYIRTYFCQPTIGKELEI